MRFLLLLFLVPFALWAVDFPLGEEVVPLYVRVQGGHKPIYRLVTGMRQRRLYMDYGCVTFELSSNGYPLSMDRHKCTGGERTVVDLLDAVKRENERCGPKDQCDNPCSTYLNGQYPWDVTQQPLQVIVGFSGGTLRFSSCHKPYPFYDLEKRRYLTTEERLAREEKFYNENF